MGEDKFELPLADSISVHDDLLRLLFVLGVEFLEQFLDLILGVGNVLNSSLLYRDCGDELKSTRKAPAKLFIFTLEGTGSIEPTIAAIDGRPNSPAAGWVTSAPKFCLKQKPTSDDYSPRTMTGSFMMGDRIFDGMETFWPPTLVFILSSKFTIVDPCFIAFCMVCAHKTCVITPISVSAMRFTSA